MKLKVKLKSYFVNKLRYLLWLSEISFCKAIMKAIIMNTASASETFLFLIA